MYFRILKKDLKRKKTMNMILLIFIILASMFIASSANNIMSVVTALDGYFTKANVPNYGFATMAEEIKQYEAFAKKNDYDYEELRMIQMNPKDVYIDEKEFDYDNTLLISSLPEKVKLFDSSDREILQVKEGEIYVPSNIFYMERNSFKIGGKIKITINDVTKVFILKDYMKDALYGSPMLGMTRFLISEEDYSELLTEDAQVLFDGYVYTEDAAYYEKFYDLSLNGLFNIDKETLRITYIMDLVAAVIILVVSVCLILISMVLLRFTINFTISEDFREIGVMKALGLTYGAISRLYTVKYFAISAFGAAVGFVLSIPFGELLLRDVSKRIILIRKEGVLLNFLCAVFTAVIVIWFCRSCTGKIRKFSPIDAIRNGQSGERFSRKSVLRLEKTKISAVPFLAANDICSEIRKFVTMILIFMIGMLLITVPANIINTVQSGHMLAWFNMAEADHFISTEMILSSDASEKLLMDKLKTVKEFLSAHHIAAEVFQEEIFRVSVSYDGKKTSSLAFLGVGDITADQYTYIDGTPPQNTGEIALSTVIAERIGAEIGDDVEIINGDEAKTYIVAALFQSMNNMGEGIRFYQEEEFDAAYLQGTFAIQIKYMDHPDKKALVERKELLKEVFSDGKVYTASEYVDAMIGEVSQQLAGVNTLIFIIVLCINSFVTVLMVKSFITKEKGGIALIKAVGFQNASIVAWQSMRIGIIVLLAAIPAALFSGHLSMLTAGPVFRLMGAQEIELAMKPLEIFVLYPLAVFCAAVFAGTLTALQVRNIKASEVSNME